MADLRKKIDLALIKKMGVISLPYHFWQNDPKINPPASQLLWAALLLEDSHSVATVVGIIHKEMEESHAASSSKNSQNANHVRLTAKIKALADDFLSMAPTQEFRQILAARCKILNSYLY